MQLEPTSLDIDENGVTPASLRKAIKAGAKRSSSRAAAAIHLVH